MAGQGGRLLLVCLVAGLITAFFLGIYRLVEMPIGWDTARYLDQTNLVSRYGLREASDLVIPRPSQLLSSRIGFPVSVLTLSSLLGVSTFKVAAVIPVVAATAAALAAGAFISYSLRRDVWDMVVVAAVVGTSTALVRLMFGTYTDNLIAASLFTAVLIPLLSAVRDGRGFIAAIALLAMGGLVHPAFYGFMLATLALVVVLYLPSSWREWRREDASLVTTPAVRLGLITGAASLLSAAGIYGLLNANPSRVGLKRKTFADKMAEDVPLYWFPVTAPLAALGVAGLADKVRKAARTRAATGDGGHRREDSFSTRFVFTLLMAWAGVAVAGLLGFYLGRAWPAHRFLAFLLPFPIFIGLGTLAVGRSLWAPGFRVAGILVILAGLLGTGYLALWDFRAAARRGFEYLDVGKVQNATTAASYLQAAGVPETAPVVFLITDIGPQPRLFIPEQAHIMRSALPPERIPHSYFYVGTAGNYLARRPTTLANDPREFNIVSTRFFRSVQEVIDRHPVAIMLESYNPEFAQLARISPDRVVAPGVYVVEGPVLASPLPASPYPSAPQGWSQIILMGAAGLIALTLIGAGWALALLAPGVRPMEVIGVAMGFGFGALLLAGAAADFMGVRLVGVGGAMTAVGAAVVGWILGGFRLARRRISLVRF